MYNTKQSHVLMLQKQAFAIFTAMVMLISFLAVSKSPIVLASSPLNRASISSGDVKASNNDSLSSDGKYYYNEDARLNTEGIILTGYAVPLDSDGHLIIPDQIIPDYIDGYKVTSIDYGFGADVADSLRSIVIPNSVVTIGSGTFQNCQFLTEVTFGSGLTTIGYDAFKSTALTNITIPDNVKVIDRGAFSDCSNLTSVTFDSGLRYIGDMAFQSTSLTNVTISENVILGDSPFPEAVGNGRFTIIEEQREYSL